MLLLPFTQDCGGYVYYHFADLPSTKQYLQQHPALPCPIICVSRKNETGATEMALRYRLSHAAGTHAGLRQKITLHLAGLCGFTLSWPGSLYERGEKIATVFMHKLPISTQSCEVIIGIHFKAGDITKNIDLNHLLPAWLDLLAAWQERPFLSVEDTVQWQVRENYPESPACRFGIDQKGRQVRFAQDVFTFIPSP